MGRPGLDVCQHTRLVPQEPDGGQEEGQGGEQHDAEQARGAESRDASPQEVWMSLATLLERYSDQHPA